MHHGSGGGHSSGGRGGQQAGGRGGAMGQSASMWRDLLDVCFQTVHLVQCIFTHTLKISIIAEFAGNVFKLCGPSASQ